MTDPQTQLLRYTAEGLRSRANTLDGQANRSNALASDLRRAGSVLMALANEVDALRQENPMGKNEPPTPLTIVSATDRKIAGRKLRMVEFSDGSWLMMNPAQFEAIRGRSDD